jgi:hypothetical protein
MEQLQRARDSLLASLPAARTAARRAKGEVSVVQEENGRRLLRVEHQAALTQEEVDRIERALTAIAGAQAVPQEEHI